MVHAVGNLHCSRDQTISSAAVISTLVLHYGIFVIGLKRTWVQSLFDTSSSWLEMFVSGRNQKPIICVIPICVQLFVVAGFVFDITAHNVIAVWTESTLSVVVGRFFFREDHP